ncbi:OprP Phosphate-selective porin [Methylophilaceae bacterium]
MQFKFTQFATALLASGIISLPLAAHANDSSELEELRSLVQELNQQVKVLARKGEITEEETAAAKKTTPVVKASASGFGLESADGKNAIKFRGLIQTDGRVFANGKNLTSKAASGASTAGYLDNTESAKDTALLRRIRPTLEGTVYGKYDFRFTPEFGDGKSQVVDAYTDARFDPAFKIRAGKYKPFVGLERLQSGSDIKFLERSYVSNILPNRDVGISAYGDVLEGKFSYAIGVHNGVADGGDNTTASDANSDKDFSARIFASPFKDVDNALAGLSFGIGGTTSKVSGTTKDTVSGSTTELTSGYKTEGQQTFFKYNDSTVLRTGVGETTTAAPSSTLAIITAGAGPTWLVHADGKRSRIAPQASYYYGPFGLIGEYVRESQGISVGAENLKKITLHNDAWQVAGSWLLTGEDASFKGVKPKNNFDFDKKTWGAWEVVARYSELNIDGDAFTYDKLDSGAVSGTLKGTSHYLYADPNVSAKSAKTWTAGINWYLNPDVKFTLNYEQTKFDGGGGSLVSTSATESANLTTQRTAQDREDEKAILARFQVAF